MREREKGAGGVAGVWSRGIEKLKRTEVENRERTDRETVTKRQRNWKCGKKGVYLWRNCKKGGANCKKNGNMFKTITSKNEYEMNPILSTSTIDDVCVLLFGKEDKDYI